MFPLHFLPNTNHLAQIKIYSKTDSIIIQCPLTQQEAAITVDTQALIAVL